MKNNLPLLWLVLLLLIPVKSWADQTTSSVVKMTLPDGSVYTGGIKNGLFHGQGMRLHPNGEKYEGNYVDGQASGRGVWSTQEGRYEGQFLRGMYDGTGILIRANKYRYEGEFKDGEFDGNGVYASADGYKAKGQFKAGQLNGTGSCVYASGTTATGEFKNGELNGTGIKQYADGWKAEGMFKNGVLNGQGVLWSSSGKKYEGFFKNGKLESLSTPAYPEGGFMRNLLTGLPPNFPVMSVSKPTFWLTFFLVISLFFNIVQARSGRSQNWFKPQLPEKRPPDYPGVLKDTERLEKIAILESEVQAEALDALLAERGIPHEMHSYHDSALDGVYLSRGWGHVAAPKEQAAAVLQALKDLSSPPSAETPA